MQHRHLLQAVALLPAWALLERGIPLALAASASGIARLDKSPDEWRALLPAAAWRVLFEEATEPAGSSPLDGEQRDGTYVCAACYLPLFDSHHKYDSGTGWPSFTQPIDPAHVGRKRDFRLIWPRIEYHCARCGGHQGHLFDDGPPPRGERWCNNGLALRFVPRAEALPELRG
jgi:peptide-methionine (R)-S-oxide reductase